MSDYTPDTDDIKWAYQEQCNHYYADCEIKPKEHANEFDRWLAEHDAVRFQGFPNGLVWIALDAR